MSSISYTRFGQSLAPYPIFSVRDIVKIFPDFDSRRLVEWQKKGYIQKIINRWYRFTGTINGEEDLWWIANRIYSPSYVSLESALAYHGLIPEGVFAVTSITTLKTQSFRTLLCPFYYKTMKPSLFFGYFLLQTDGKSVKMADLEKTLFDYFYLKPYIKDVDDFEGLRLNTFLLKKHFNKERMDIYLKLANSPSLTKRINSLINYFENA